MKKLINDPADVVVESIAGLAKAHPDLVDVRFDPNYVVRRDAPVTDKVAIVSGGGSGHEPMHAGFVGPGMLDAACPGAVFTSPTPDQMLEATKAVDSGAGVVHIVKNYTGDVMNFQMAADLAKADGHDVRSVTINDDVAVEDSLYTAGRRGVGTTVLAEKICGAAAEEGQDLEAVSTLCERINSNGRSMGIALTSCMTPQSGEPTFDLGEDEMEVGIGIHGEPGRRREPLAPASEIARMLAEPIIDDAGIDSGNRVLAFMNGMGGSPEIELYLMYNELASLLESRNITIARSLVGSYITSLEMAGCSVTLLKVDDEMLRLWDAPVETAALRWGR